MWNADYQNDPDLPQGIAPGTWMYIYQHARLIQAMNLKIFGPVTGQFQALGYRRRQSSNPLFESDDRDVVVVTGNQIAQTITARMFYDDAYASDISTLQMLAA